MVEDEARGVLFILNESLVTGGCLSPEYKESLQKMISLTFEDPFLLRFLDNWKFIEKQFPYLMRDSEVRHEAFGLAIRILQDPTSSLPVLFTTRKGGFLLSEALYDSMDDPQDVISFCEEAAKKSSLLPGVLHDCGFFILLNSLVCEETVRFYSSIFACKIYEAKGSYRQVRSEGIMHEIKRKYFDPEIAFKDGAYISFKEPPSFHKVGHRVLKSIFDDVYNTTFFNLLDLGLDKSLNLMNYCEWDYSFLYGSSELRDLVSSGNYLAIRVYRKMLESLHGCARAIFYLQKVEDEDLMIHIARLLECKDAHVVMECVLVLYNYYHLFEWNLDKKQFNENRIRKIFGLLEYSYSDCPCLQECICSQSDSSAGIPEEERATDCLKGCNTVKILCLLSHIYAIVDKRYFYKPSFLVLVKAWDDILGRHRCWNRAFTSIFFTDIISFLRTNPYNVARIIFPFKKPRKKARNAFSDKKDDKENSNCFSMLASEIDLSEIEGLDELNNV
ncbi:hypothetical protein EHEL_020250 [Encephalitozoon hellem ATCC 50504]|uniref:Uncharacterized protein n=1 Tax=Encephalitozoon hellem TaxID=27973 RepID=A0A9Q9C4U1_ENCHE|nr:uncharacterized protein EHEL_020250 [Encephalitozoon hellem ATCC 50504]AFM97782.1 hypothetical protein EHEL_020250 [Encephalitozoon hellem ATCC 50504]UTX42552.1 hypothetical protein GPU96_02g02620 [Encephalitozoon hellem]|eukprot:XP_003886763.1 hypothetical protein EHEL_020250 [Encephalitozoon hellem ATCC 50504]